MQIKKKKTKTKLKLSLKNTAKFKVMDIGFVAYLF